MAQIETRTDPMIINMGPHHPSMHGCFRLIVTLDGEDIVDCEPVIGYLHRGMEKIAESRTNTMYVPYVSRWDYYGGMFNEAVTVNAPEQLADIEVPKRASYIRTIMLELTRLTNHLLWFGPSFVSDLGGHAPFFYALREREIILDLFEAATGYRLINNNYFRIGGVAADLPYGWVDKCLDFCDYFIPKIDEYEKLVTDNPIFLRRVEGIGTITRDDAINWGLSGPMLRASGVKWDLRKVDHYECYDDFDWEIAWATEGDCLARYRVRMKEMRESTKIVRQACESLPGGAYENLEAKRLLEGRKSQWNDFDYNYIAKKLSPTFKIPAGEHYVRVEAGRGELGIYLIGNDNVFPWRWKIRPADFNNLQILPFLLKGVKVADLVAILASIDVVMGSVDR
ncbi:NAD(P)H-quinone oxidoreductase subunit H [Lusitaniella coriacea LEGE 07157]|uniref:NAD(P)H-quinone oxidoreductase subunit H n=1 Tax=Lusitaniella coriacea LEGE 07157 TaxID=945747 RepID=A0A8J7IUV5_9CYAN|nr:NAD(P)H-quinone oxidoreductase subunit H [Lusitaniella coriacea]MBE9117962.1 NAD(P)H-quinone oxidoreductase subunit H [Lusitaniella coriacea LEGE 07157]